MQRPLFLAIGVAFAIALAGPAGAGDWPTISRNLARDGFTADCVRPPYETKWIRSWPGEIVTTRVQAIVADGKVFIGTYSGRLHAVDAETGADLWTFQADGPILHSPAFEGGMIHFGAASPSRSLFCLRARDGEIVWKSECGEGGFCTSPAIAGARILIGGRDGIFRAIAAISGREEWSFRTGGPIRTTAAISGDRVFVASDDMHAYALRIADGGLVWKSEKMYGQSLRDYAPVVLGDVVVFRTNPMEQMGVHLGRSYNLIGRTAGIDMSSWKNVDAFVKSEKARGSPEAFEKEQRAILEYLASHPQARTFYALDAATGKERFRAPVLWGAGCQGVGIPPVRVGDGRAIVFNRTAYGNWTLGVAPMVGLQAIDLRADPRPPEEALGSIPTIRTIPLFHSKGNQPPWNTYWGTADETSVYSCGGTILYVTHQGTLSGYDLETHDLFPIAGKRDTWGGESSLPWARNEWHGPARGAVAIAGDSLYWVTGSRIIAIRGRGADPNAAGERSKRANEAGGMIRAPAGAEELRRRLDRAVSDYLSAPDYAPLLIEIGLGSHDFFFDTAAEVVATLAMADPYLERGLQVRARERMRREMGRHPLCGKESRYALDVGERRELYTITGERFFYGWEAPEALSEAYALWLYGDRTGDWGTVERYWPRARGAFEAVAAKGWSVDIEKGDRFANGSIAGMIGVARLARRFGDEKTADAASRAAAENLRRLAEHWRNGVASLPFDQKIENVAAVDGFIGAGNALFFKVVPHRQKIVKFLDLTPEVGRAIADEAPEAARFYLDFVDLVLPGWYLAFEERQVHFGENYADFPDLALGVFEAKAWIEGAPGDALARWVDIPWCRGDLYYIRKLAIAIEAMDAQSSAGDILEAAGIQGGLVVHLGCGDGRLTAALHASDAYLVQGLDEDPDAVRRARHHVDSLGLYGPVSIDVLRGQSLPYADNLVNLVVVTGRGSGVTREELARVLAPNGVAMIRGAPCDLDGWTKWVKPRPADIDEWTHYLHGPDNNAVSRDAVVGPPRHLQWIAPPRFSRSHDHLASVSAVVSAGGRLFSIIDGGSIAFVAAAPRWRLIARDASSGVRLWERNVGDWEYHLRDFRSGPADIARRLVAAGDRVYVTLGYGEPVTALDAATGETIHTYAETEGTREILCCDGMLLLVLGKPNRDWPAQEAKRIVSQPDYRPPFELYTPPPHDLRVMAVDAANGKLLWRNDGPEAREALPSTLAAADGSVYFQSPDAVVCLDATTGLSRWKAPRPAHRKRLAWSTPTLVVRDGIVFSADRRAADTSGEILWLPSGGYHEYIRGEDIDGELIAFDARTGERLWSAPAYEGFNAPVDVLIADGLLDRPVRLGKRPRHHRSPRPQDRTGRPAAVGRPEVRVRHGPRPMPSGEGDLEVSRPGTPGGRIRRSEDRHDAGEFLGARHLPVRGHARERPPVCAAPSLCLFGDGSPQVRLHGPRACGVGTCGDAAPGTRTDVPGICLSFNGRRIGCAGRLAHLSPRFAAEWLHSDARLPRPPHRLEDAARRRAHEPRRCRGRAPGRANGDAPRIRAGCNDRGKALDLRRRGPHRLAADHPRRAGALRIGRWSCLLFATERWRADLEIPGGAPHTIDRSGRPARIGMARLRERPRRRRCGLFRRRAHELPGRRHAPLQARRRDRTRDRRPEARCQGGGTRQRHRLRRLLARCALRGWRFDLPSQRSLRSRSRQTEGQRPSSLEPGRLPGCELVAPHLLAVRYIHGERLERLGQGRPGGARRPPARHRRRPCLRIRPESV